MFPSTIFPTLPLGQLPLLLHAILLDPPPATHPSEFNFAWSDAAALHNWNVLPRHKTQLRDALAAQPYSTLTPASEFRSPATLVPFLSRHSLWPRFSERISLGAEFPLAPIADTDRLTDVSAALARGNHTSARGHE